MRTFISELASFPQFQGLVARETWSPSLAFARMKVRLKREIITLRGVKTDPLARTGERLAPSELKDWLDGKRDVLLVDTRNKYEVQEGTFQGAIDLGLDHFSDFPARLEEVREKAAGRPVVMFCTGGIRCEKATAVALDQGLRDVYQLEGGILSYFEKTGGAHFNGRCFVFDERVALSPGSPECP